LAPHPLWRSTPSPLIGAVHRDMNTLAVPCIAPNTKNVVELDREFMIPM